MKTKYTDLLSEISISGQCGRQCHKMNEGPFMCFP